MKRNVMKRAHQIAKGLEGDYRARMSLALRQAWKEERGMKKNYAAYHIDGTKANEFREAALKLFAMNPELKKEIQWRMCNLDRETMSFDLTAGPNTPKEIIELAEKFGTGKNSYA
jgi:hypothetical protein